MTTNLQIDNEDLTDILKMFESCCDHKSPMLRGLLHADLQHTLHEDFGLCFADTSSMVGYSVGFLDTAGRCTTSDGSGSAQRWLVLTRASDATGCVVEVVLWQPPRQG